jgi:hypothetical protein
MDGSVEGGPIVDENGDPVIYYSFQDKGGMSSGPTTTRYRGTVSTSGPKLRPTHGRVAVAVTFSSGSLTKLVFTNFSSKGNVVITYNFNGNGHFNGKAVGQSTVSLNGTYKATALPGGGINAALRVNESNNIKGRLTVRVTPRVVSAGAVETKNGVTVDRQFIHASLVRGSQN